MERGWRLKVEELCESLLENIRRDLDGLSSIEANVIRWRAAEVAEEIGKAVYRRSDSQSPGHLKGKK
jgi:hypothetical protein